MKLFPSSAIQQLEFDKIKTLLAGHCRTEYARYKADNLRIHTRKEFIEPELRQAYEYKLFFQNHLHFPDDAVINLNKELKLLSIDGAVLAGNQFLLIKKLTASIQQIFRWFDNDRRIAFPFLALVINETYFEKAIVQMIDEVLDEDGNVKDNASEELAEIRMRLFKKRNELRRLFDRIVSRLNKQGYLAEIEESFMNGRRVLAVFAEQKRMIKGILHGESDSRRTAFIEPEETTGLNNEIFSLENAERKEVYRILQRLTANMCSYHSLLTVYHTVLGEYDFIRAKAKLAMEYNGNMPAVHDKAFLKLVNACHPLLFIYNEKQQKPTIPVNLALDDMNRILVISGPNAGGKTVTLKTAGLLQMMLQSGLLISCSPESEFGIFKQLMIHIGDTQSLEFELSTYSSHLMNMKYFMENANGKSLFFIDELGSGSDPNLGGAFAEVIMEELAKKHAIGIVTTHYLNLKVMANKVQGIMNGAMAFDEKNLKPLYKLIVGKPGSSYTFSIAERIGLHPSLINKARKLVDENHFSLDKLLNRTEQDLQQVQAERKNLDKLLKENEKLKEELEQVMNRERHSQQIELLKHQNKISEEKLLYLKDMERRLKSIVIEWKKTEDKNALIKMIQSLLFKQREKQVVEKQQKKLDKKFIESSEPVKEGDKVKMIANRQVGVVTKIRGKKAIVQVGSVPITVDVTELIVVKDKVAESP
ncbi:DNA mismatch repair protein MutS [Ginsengibacter hankyongi]|uniref:DNA mismatch repair protein MutS n=1 Tax=Ginsengibacter hankyongi TaxID=2607284 RepID=A0A5J5IE60_9BACT|nr:MutS2/Smr-associated SH3 domain-containing protein [Ginsengibacter hankyongi]KAA9037698.1 DNA mismatch repair protein MutS [Ginsengibacter hankyongi]